MIYRVGFLMSCLLMTVHSFASVDYMATYCDSAVTVYYADELILESASVPGINQCKVDMQAGSLNDETDISVRISFLNFNVPCNEGSVKISNIESGDTYLCGDSAGDNFYKSNADIVTIEFIKTGVYNTYTSSFNILVTKVNNGFCRYDEFMCDNLDCIDKVLLVCDGNNNCGDNSDEASYTCFWTVSVIAGVSIGAGGFMFMVVVCVLLVALRRRRNGRVIYNNNSSTVPIKSQMIAQPYYVQQPYQPTAAPPPAYQASQDGAQKN